MNISLDSSSTESDVFYVEQSSVEGSPIRNNTPAILISTEISVAMEREVITISSVASPGPRIVTLDSDFNVPTIPYGFGSQQPIVPPSLNDLNVPLNPFNMLAIMAVIRADDAYCPQSPEPSIPSPISTPPMNGSTIEGWGTQHIAQLTMPRSTRMMSPEESTRMFRRATPSTPTSQEMCLSPRDLPPLRCLHEDKKRNSAKGCLFSKRGSVAPHLRGMRLTLTTKKDPLMLRRNSNLLLLLLNFHYNSIMYFNCCPYIQIRI